VATAARDGSILPDRQNYVAWLDGYVRRHGFGDSDLRAALDAARVDAGTMEMPAEPQPPRVGGVRFGDFARDQPFSRTWGFDRGTPVDRPYIEKFLARNSSDIRGTVLEIKDAAYTQRFGGSAVLRSEVLDLTPTRDATIVGDLTDASSLPTERFDCIVLTQTLQLIYDVKAALRTIRGMLRPGGILLLTVPGITLLDHAEASDSWYWSFTPRSVRRLLEEGLFAEIDVEGNGNVMTAAAFLYGMASEELPEEQFAIHDADYPVLITGRARKPPASERRRRFLRHGPGRRDWRSLWRGKST
jgi:SAM-dependent methyltransferase